MRWFGNAFHTGYSTRQLSPIFIHRYKSLNPHTFSTINTTHENDELQFLSFRYSFPLKLIQQTPNFISSI
ncbi:hypothetical protein L1987_29266 [Smallanthus sonchifolius]|uniref:Uncharacterized protein n=1 Tax=Smallanthus sonchifolius TaxID=185202 RepID=A0ACB9I0C5_9ASTR|nr:hypothetical protein L1987_29266 [Smallanthus sonchifolius]